MIGRQSLRIHLRKEGEDTIGSRVLLRESCLVRNSFDKGVTGRETSLQGRREKGMSSGKSPDCTG